MRSEQSRSWPLAQFTKLSQLQAQTFRALALRLHTGTPDLSLVEAAFDVALASERSKVAVTSGASSTTSLPLSHIFVAWAPGLIVTHKSCITRRSPIV